MITKTCALCGKQFETYNNDQKYCSKACYHKKPKKQKKEEQHKTMPEVPLARRCEIAKKHGMSYGQMDAYLRLNGKTWMDMGRRETMKELPGKESAIEALEQKIVMYNEKIRAYQETIEDLAHKRDEIQAFVEAVK